MVCQAQPNLQKRDRRQRRWATSCLIENSMPIKASHRIAPRAACAAIREARYDMTEYVIHVTNSLDSLSKILNAGHIKATYSQMGNVYSSIAKPTVRGLRPAVCFTDQPLWAFIDTMNTCGGRWSGYGIAFHKVPLFQMGARPVWYVSRNELGSEVGEGHKLYRKNRRIHAGKIPPDLQYLCVLYDPDYSRTNYNQIDFTWEREWRYAPSSKEYMSLCVGWGVLPVIVVRDDNDRVVVRTELRRLASAGKDWAVKIQRVISLETAIRKLADGDKRYGRVETWPFVLKKKSAIKKKK